MKYTKPEINIINDYPEDVYMSSGSQKYTKCKSIYLNGTYQKPTYNPIQDGYKVGRGCEGCPASDGSSCRFDSHPEQMNWDGDFRPSWEIQGHLPDEKGY